MGRLFNLKLSIFISLLLGGLVAQAQVLCPRLEGSYICYEKPPTQGTMVQSNQGSYVVYQWTEAGQTTTIATDGQWHDLPLDPKDPPNTIRRNRNSCFGGQRVNINFTTEMRNAFRQTVKTEVIDQVLIGTADGMKVETRVFTNGSQTSSQRFFCKRQ